MDLCLVLSEKRLKLHRRILGIAFDHNINSIEPKGNLEIWVDQLGKETWIGKSRSGNNFWIRYRPNSKLGV